MFTFTTNVKNEKVFYSIKNELIMKLSFEILLSTMFKTDLSFLKKIFAHEHFSNFNILIINQTDEEKVLISDYENIRVINSLERGSPASRNLAIKNAIGDICLMADDDIVYQPNLKETILEAYSQNSDMDMISFEAIDENEAPYANYYPEGNHDKISLKEIYTWVITFKREVFNHYHIYFNHFFGVGSVFKGETEYVFLRNAFDKNLKMYHISKTIVMHPYESSGRKMGGDEAIYARSALTQRFYGNLSYFWLIKYLFFVWRNNYINLKQIPLKFKIGLKGISKYKKLKKTGEIDKIYVN